MRYSFLFLILVLMIKQASAQSNQGTSEVRAKTFVAYNILDTASTRNNWEIMAVDMDGGQPVNLTQHKDVAWTYTSYKNKLYFVSDRDTCFRCFFLYEKNAFDDEPRKVSALQLEDSYMSTRNKGTEMVVSGRIGKSVRYQLFIIDIVNGSFKQITNDTAAMYRDPCFSPDGKKIVCAYQKNKRDRSAHEELYIMDADGKNFKQLTEYPTDNPSFKENGYKAGPPRWHPSGKFISYASLQDGGNKIFKIKPDGSGNELLIGDTLQACFHDWSPDGKWLAYDSTDKEEQQYQIMLWNSETGEKKQLTTALFKSQLGPVFISE
jgi:TolB protein